MYLPETILSGIDGYRLSLSMWFIAVITTLLILPFTIQSALADSPQQLSDLRTCTVQEKNIQGRVIVGTALDNVCEGTNHSETILGLQGNDILIGKGGDDVIQGNEGDDKVFGNAGDDLLQGNFGDDKIDGGGRNDVLIGGEGDDILSGEDGNDKLYGYIGNDILKGGPGANEFVCGEGIDTVLDYNPAQGDIISNDCEVVNT